MATALRVRLGLLAVLGIFGLFLLQGGITGFVISQSCCIPGEGIACAPENVCNLQQPSPGYSPSLIGTLIILLAVALVVAELRWEEKRRKKEYKKSIRVV